MSSVEDSLFYIHTTIDGFEIIRAVVVEDVGQHIDIHRLRPLSKTTVRKGYAVRGTLILVQSLEFSLCLKGEAGHHL